MKKLNLGKVVIAPKKVISPKKEEIDIIDYSKVPKILSFIDNIGPLTLTWDSHNLSWIEKRPNPKGENKPWIVIKKKEVHWEAVATCWCGSKLYSHSGVEKQFNDETLKRFKAKHKNCGIKNQIIKADHLHFDFKGENE